MIQPANMSRIAVVAIGRNEGARLEACLASASAAACKVIYVDSGSSDGSVDIAERLGAEVVHLDPTEGFTAAKARNMGAARLSRPEGLDFIQFVDGDCVLAEGWLDIASKRLDADPGLAVVAGRRREQFPDASIFNRLCDMEWNTPVGEARAVGGDALYRRAAFEAVGGFDSDYICGEEPELCFRLRAAGWRVVRMDAEMTRHDAAIFRWRQWWKRTVRSGWAFAEGAHRMGASSERYNRRELRSVIIWGALWPAVALILLFAAIGGVGTIVGWVALVLLLLAVAAFGAMTLRIARNRKRQTGDPLEHARIYGALVMLGKPAQAHGALCYAMTSIRGRRGAIIEYK